MYEQGQNSVEKVSSVSALAMAPLIRPSMNAENQIAIPHQAFAGADRSIGDQSS